MFGLNRWLKRLDRNNSKRLQKGLRREPVMVERLEDRVLLYATSGNAWPNKDLITISFMPDGTNLGGATSNLVSTFNTKFGTAATWQNQFLKAAQYWAQQTNINFAVVTDNGAVSGSGANQQGDPNFGDIRIGGFNFGNSNLAQAYLPPPINNYSIAGDIQINTGAVFNVGTQYDLFTVAVHEFGHALGLNHATATAACMFSAYNGVDAALNADDISGVKAIYSAGAARAADTYEANETTSAAKLLTLDSTSKAVVINGLNLTTSTDVDYFKIVVPSGATTTLKATVATSGLSLLSPKIEIIVGSTTKATGAAGATEYGVNKTATYTNATDLAATKTVYIKVSSANALAAFKTGKYALILNMGTGADPTYTKTTTTLANGTPLSSGGGVAIKLSGETAVNAASTATQQTSDQSVATAPNGNAVVTWASQNQDGSGWGVYARRYDATGAALGGEFQVNTTTAGDQLDPNVAVDLDGNFTIAWTSADGSGTGIFAQRYNLLGAPIGGEFQVNVTTSGDQTAPSIAMDGLGDVLVSWTSVGQDGSGTAIYARSYVTTLPASLAIAQTTTFVTESTPFLDSGEFRVNTFTLGDQLDSAAVANRLTGDFVIVWSSVSQDGSGLGIYGQRFSGATGAAAGNEFKVNTTTSGDQSDAAIGINRFTSEFVVTWTSAGQDGSGNGIYAQQFKASGAAQGSEFRANTTVTGDQTDSSVAVDGAGEFYVLWTNAAVTANGLQVNGQQFDKHGLKKEAELVINATTAGNQSRASVSIDVYGRVTAVWSGNGTGDSAGVFVQRYRTDLHPLEVEQAGQGDNRGVVPPTAAVLLDRLRETQRGHHGQAPLLSSPQRHLDPWSARLQAYQITLPSFDAGNSHQARTSAEQPAELSLAIDQLFGSAAWLGGKHYRKASLSQ